MKTFAEKMLAKREAELAQAMADHAEWTAALEAAEQEAVDFKAEFGVFPASDVAEVRAMRGITEAQTRIDAAKLGIRACERRIAHQG